MKITLDMNTQRLASRLHADADQAQIVLDTQVLKDSNYYVLMDQRYLSSSAIRASEPGSGQVVWDMPYARKRYYTVANISRDSNPNATIKWFEVAKSIHKNEWILISAKAGGWRDKT